jgi:tetratricopeptide (TPR) repeat protein
MRISSLCLFAGVLIAGSCPQGLASAFDRGNLLFAKKDYRRAIVEFSASIRARPNDYDAYMQRANAEDAAGNYPAAIEDYTKALELNPKDAIYYFMNRADTESSAENYSAAVADLSKAIKIGPKWPGLYVNRGHAKKDSGDVLEQSQILAKR